MATKTQMYLSNREPQVRCSISRGNKKMGSDFPSFSFPPVSSFYMKERICTKCSCNCGAGTGSEKNLPCYAKVHIYDLYKQTAAAYEDNYWTYKHDPEVIFRGIEAAILTARTFRFFVSGDIPDSTFFEREVEIVKRNPHCEVLQFTKKFDIVNDWITKNGALPDNLHLIFSAWKGLEMNNPYRLPECHLIYNDGTTTASDDKLSRLCSGNCTECFIKKMNCFKLEPNQQILIHAH